MCLDLIITLVYASYGNIICKKWVYSNITESDRVFGANNDAFSDVWK
jgi:hypothetical protein